MGEEITVDYLVDNYGFARNVLVENIEYWGSSGVYEEEFLDFVYQKAEGVVRFPLEYFPAVLCPKNGVTYNNHFFLSLRDLCGYYNISSEDVKRGRATGISLERAIDRARASVTGSILNERPDEFPYFLTVDTLSSENFGAMITLGMELPEVKEMCVSLGRGVTSCLRYLMVQHSIKQGVRGCELYFGELPKRTRTLFNVGKAEFFEKMVEGTTKLKRGRKQIKTRDGKLIVTLNTYVLENDAYCYGKGINSFIKDVLTAGVMHMYLIPEHQPVFKYHGCNYENIEDFCKQMDLGKCDLRLRIVNTGGNIDLAVNSARLVPFESRTYQYYGKEYPSIISMSRKFDVGYQALRSRLQACFLPNPTRTIEDVIDEIIFNKNNWYLDLGGRKVFLRVNGVDYENMTSIIKALDLDGSVLMDALRSGDTLEDACKKAKHKKSTHVKA